MFVCVWFLFLCWQSLCHTKMAHPLTTTVSWMLWSMTPKWCSCFGSLPLEVYSQALNCPYTLWCLIHWLQTHMQQWHLMGWYYIITTIPPCHLVVNCDNSLESWSEVTLISPELKVNILSLTFYLYRGIYIELCNGLVRLKSKSQKLTYFLTFKCR